VGGDAFVPWTLAPAASPDGIEVVAEDHEEPRFEICPPLEGRAALPRLDQRFLAKIIGFVAIAAQRARKGAKERDQIEEFGPELRVVVRRLGRVRAAAGGLGHVHGLNHRACRRSA
jgi:hypothetical protein